MRGRKEKRKREMMGKTAEVKKDNKGEGTASIIKALAVSLLLL